MAIYKKMLDDPEFKIALTDVRTGEREVWRKLGSKADRYRKALDEIEEIVNEPCVADVQEDCKHCGFWCEHKDILDIINKAKGE